MKIRLVLMAAVATLLAVWCAPPAMADSIQLQCGSCTLGSTSLISSGTNVQFSFVDVSNSGSITGNAFIAILVPTGGAAPSFTGGTLEGTGVSFTSGDLGGLLGESFMAYTLSNFKSASAQVGITPTGYTVYEYSLGTGVTLGPGGAGITGLTATAPQGSVIVGFIETPNGTYQTPLTESITVPEPSSLGLLVVGLVGLLGVSMLRPRQEVGSA